jgi:hypothetical protein
MNRRADTEPDGATDADNTEQHEAADADAGIAGRTGQAASASPRPDVRADAPVVNPPGRPPVFEPDRPPTRPPTHQPGPIVIDPDSPIFNPPARPPIFDAPGGTIDPTAPPPVFDPGGGTLPSDPSGGTGPALPVNDERVELLPDYFPGDLFGNTDPENVNGVLQGLLKASTDINPLSHGPGVAVNAARKRLAAILGSQAFATVRERLTGVEGGPGLVDSMLLQTDEGVPQFGVALGHVDAIKAIVAGGLEPVSEATIHKAFTTAPTEYFAVTSTDENEPDAGVRRTLPGYAGPVVTTTERFRLSDLSELVAGGPERDFRLPLLGGECLMGLRRFGEALDEYVGLLSDTTLSEPRREFAAVRKALANLARGDVAYRSERRLSAGTREAAQADYSAALKTLAKHGVRPDNSLRVEIVARANQQRAKLAAGVNPLGYRDSFVPPQPFEFLEVRAKENAAAAKDAERLYIEFQEKGDQLADVEAELRSELKNAEDNLGIAGDRESIARATVGRVEAQAELLRSQQGFLVPATVFGGIESILRPFGGINDPGPLQGTQVQAGLTSTLVGFAARREELGIQEKMAEFDRRIAEHEATIAALETQIAQRRVDFVSSRLEITGGRDLNKDVFYALARAYEEIAKSRLETAILVGYFYERAVAFHLGRSELIEIDFDYADGPTGILGAPKALEDALTEIDNAFVVGPVPERDDFTDRIFLRSEYPIEFSGLLQTGAMDFAISLYQLNKLRPGSTMGRLSGVTVELRGSLPTNLSLAGLLIHRGRFLLRDGPSTPEPPEGRFIPTEAEIEAALAAQEQGRTILASVGGVIVFDLGQDAKELDATTVTDSTDSGLTYLLDTFQGYGPAGLWRLEIDPSLLGAVTEIVLHLHTDAFETDPDELSTRVRQLIALFEAESGDTVDRILPVLVRRRFPDAFDSLESGPATFELSDADFPFGTANPEVKAVVALALDADGQGVEGVGLEIAKPDAAFTLSRTTGSNGYSEDVTAPIPFLDFDDRFPVIGEWTIALSDPGQFPLLDDLQLFFIYQFGQS